MLPATHKCFLYWPASHAKNTCYPSTGCENFHPSQINAYCKAFLREEGGTRMRDGRSLRHLHFFACFITITFPKLRTLPQSPTAPAPSRREPFTRHILPLSLVRFSSPAIASFEPRHYGVGFCYKKPPRGRFSLIPCLSPFFATIFCGSWGISYSAFCPYA